MFIQLKDGVPIGNAVVEENLRMLFPEANFPKVFSPADVEPYGFGMYEFSQVPEIPRFYKLIECLPIKKENGIYYQNWQFEPMSDEEKNKATEEKAKQVRGVRTQKLFFSDWTQMPDVNLDSEKKSAWANYRQLLRDIPLQNQFPWEVQWPNQPE
jgi:hypothetical protein